MADRDDDAGQASGPADGRRRREPPTIDVKAVEMPVTAAASAKSSSEASSSEASSSEAAASASPPPAARPRTRWFPILAAGTLGAGLAVLAGGAAWIYFAPLDDRSTDELSARLARLELQTQGAAQATAAQIAAATVPDMGKVDAAKIDELAARLGKLETASAAAAPENGRTDIGRIEELSARISRLESAPPPPPAPDPAKAETDAAEIKDLSARVSRLESAPPPPPVPDPAKAEADAAAIKDLSARLGRVETSLAAIPPPPAPDPTLANRLTAIEAALKPIAEHVAELDRQNADNATTVQEARERAETVAKAMADVNRADADQDKLHQSAKAEIAGLDGRLDAVETLAKAIRDQVAEAAAPKADEPLRFAVVATGLRYALERGEPFTAELAAAKAIGVDPAILAGVAPFAATGVPNPPDLFRELTALIPEMLKISAPAGPDGNYLDRLQAHAEKLVRIRPVGDRAGDDPATVIGRIDRDMARRDLAGVLAELDKLPAPAQAIADPWRKKALARQAAAAFSAQLAAASFSRLDAPAGATTR
jgi:hypothetical protein